MSFFARAAVAFSGVVLVVAGVGCSSGVAAGTPTDGGIGSEGGGGGVGAAVARVTFDSEISPGTHSAKECGKTGTWFTIGRFGNPAAGTPETRVDDGAADGSGTVSVSCSVVKAAAGFDVQAHAELSGATGGAVTITGRFTSSGDQPGIAVALTKNGETFSDSSCTARIDTVLGQGIAAGRVWASVECTDATFAAAQQVCTSRAQLRFENCAQQ